MRSLSGLLGIVGGLTKSKHQLRKQYAPSAIQRQLLLRAARQPRAAHQLQHQLLHGALLCDGSTQGPDVLGGSIAALLYTGTHKKV